MYISYYDEAGDDGYPKYSSPIFVLSACYLHYLNWKETYQSIRAFRGRLKADFGIPVKMELHTKPFILNKNPYRELGLSEEHRIEIIDHFCDLISALKLKFLNVVIVKKRIKLESYNVMDKALTYSIQRIENDLNPRQHPENKFMILTDPGRVGKMRSISRRLQSINYIPSKFGPEAYRQEIQSLIEDPLEKESRESYFIQLCDLVAFVVYSYALLDTKSGKLHGRTPAKINAKRVKNWMERLKPSLNLQASGDNEYGLVMHPK
jgi:hypothetical protein